MEIIIYSQLLVYLEDYRLINKHRYRFRHGRSSSHLLAYLNLPLGCSYRSGRLTKLSSYGHHEILCKRFASFLHGRSIKLTFGGFCSEAMNARLRLHAVPYAVSSAYQRQVKRIYEWYANDSNLDAVYTGHVRLSREYVDQYQNKLVSYIKVSSGNVLTRWKELGSIQLPEETSLRVNHYCVAVSPIFQNGNSSNF